MEEKAVQNVQPLRSVQAVQTPTCVLPRGAGEEGIGRSKPHKHTERQRLNGAQRDRTKRSD